MIEKEVQIPEVTSSQKTMILFNDGIMFLTDDFTASLWNYGVRLFNVVGLAKQSTWESYIFYKFIKCCDIEIELSKEDCVLIYCHEKNLKTIEIKFESSKVRDEWYQICYDYVEQQKK